MSNVLQWPIRVPGIPYRWVLSLSSSTPSPRCLAHGARTDALGVCAQCVSDWRRSLGADPDQWSHCRVCGFPLHPAVEADGADSCPSCADDVSAAVEVALTREREP